MNKTVLIFLIPAFMLGCATPTSAPTQSPPVEEPLLQTNADPTTPPVEESPWQTHTNEEVGFSFKYPKEVFPLRECGAIKYTIIEDGFTTYLAPEKYMPRGSESCDEMKATTLDALNDQFLTHFSLHAKKATSSQEAKDFFLEVCNKDIDFIEESRTDEDGSNFVMFWPQAETIEEYMETNCYGYNAFYYPEKGIVYAVMNPKTGGGWIISDKDGNPLDFEVARSVELL